MPTADATLLPPLPKDPGSDRSLDSVGPLAVLATMVEQKKRATEEEEKKPAKVSQSYIKVR